MKSGGKYRWGEEKSTKSKRIVREAKKGKENPSPPKRDIIPSFGGLERSLT